MKVENWCGYDIRFVEVNGEWYAILKDICDALNLRTDKTASRLQPSMLERVLIDVSDDPLKVDGPDDDTNVKDILKEKISKVINRQPGKNKTRWMLAVNEQGIYQTLFASRKLEAKKFQMWTFDILKKLRKSVGLSGYEVLRMTEPDIQSRIDWILDGLYFDEETGNVMLSITIPGGDVDQIPLDMYEFNN